LIVRKCNMCGKDLDVFDQQENISYHSRMGYGSKFDLCQVDIDLCCSCFDKVMDEYIIPNCLLDPISEEVD